MVPPNKYLGYKTSRSLDQTANRSRRSVSQTDSSMVFCGARRSSPAVLRLPVMREVQFEADEEEMVPETEGPGPVREEEGCWRGSSKEFRSAFLGGFVSKGSGFEGGEERG